MKGRSIFSLIVSLTVWSASSLPATSQEITEAQIRGLRQQIETEVQNAESRARSRNLPESYKANLREYRQFWQNTNPDIAKVIGEWGGNWGASFTIFPTNKPNLVCVQYVDETESFVEPGKLKDGKIYWKSPLSGISSVLLRESNSLVVITIAKGQPNIWPQPLSLLPRPVSGFTRNKHSYPSLGCITETDVTRLKQLLPR